MILGKVVGRVWATAKNPNLEGQRLLIVQPLTPELKETGRRFVCTDCTGAGAGELVYVCRGREASYAFLPQDMPSDSTIVGIVDEVDITRGARC
jgi:ethanolamine utilization protein EutN